MKNGKAETVTAKMTNHEAGLFLIGIGIGILIVVLGWRR
jgi:hypothetical protein